MDNNVFNVAGHTVEVRYSPTGSCDPWTLDYAREKGVCLMCTSDVANFLLVDRDKLYRLKGGSLITFGHYLEKNVIDSPEAFALWLDEIKEQDFGTLSESKKQIDEMKERKMR